jgi:large subunit ribosomal protein L2
MVLDGCMATIGAVSNPITRTRTWQGRPGSPHGSSPHVRGVAMNPVDHPHGGGEGRTSGGRHPVSPTGKPTKGTKTRKNKTTDRFIIRSRQKAKGR